MSLTRCDIESFTMALADACTRDELAILVPFASGRTIERYVSPDATLLRACVSVVMGASSEGWERLLLNKARELKPNNDKLRRLEEQYRSTELPNPSDPCDATVLRANRLFIDRDDLRVRLRELKSSTAARVLKVQGARHSGKSHSRYLVDHLAENGGGFRAVVIDLVHEEIDRPDELASVIVTRIGGDEKQLPAQGETTVPRWGLFLERAIRSEVLRRGSQVWLVFDGLSKEGLPTETLGVILNLAKRADDEQELRVILLDLPGELPPEIDRFLSEEIGAIDEGKCVTWLTTFLGLRGIAPPKADLEAAVAKMFEALPVSGDKDRLRMLASEIWRIASTQIAPKEPAAGRGGST